MNNPNAADVNGMTVANYENKFLGGAPAPAPTPVVDPRTAGDADMAGYGGSPRLMPQPSNDADWTKAAGKLNTLGLGLLSAGSPRESWQPQPMQAGSPYRSKGNALSLLGTLGQSGLLG
jgi:hypothetical protein